MADFINTTVITDSQWAIALGVMKNDIENNATSPPTYRSSSSAPPQVVAGLLSRILKLGSRYRKAAYWLYGQFSLLALAPS